MNVIPNSRTFEGWHSRRQWRRLEARALAAHHSDQLTVLRRLAATAEVIINMDTEQAPSLGVLRLQLPHWTLTLAGVAPATRTALRMWAEGIGELRLVQAGRYGPHWWITISADSSLVVVLGSRLRLVPARGGISAPSPGSPTDISRSHQWAPARGKPVLALTTRQADAVTRQATLATATRTPTEQEERGGATVPTRRDHLLRPTRLRRGNS